MNKNREWGRQWAVIELLYFNMQTEIVNLFRNYDAEMKLLFWRYFFFVCAPSSLRSAFTISHHSKIFHFFFFLFSYFVYIPCTNSWSVQQSNEKCIIINNKTEEHRFANLYWTHSVWTICVQCTTSPEQCSSVLLVHITF